MSQLDEQAKISQYATEEILVTTQWLEENLASVTVVESNEDILLYDTGHIPGAVKLDWHTELNDPVVRDYYGKLVPLMYSQGPLGALGLAKGVVTNAIGRFRPMIRGPFSAAELKVWAVKSTALAAENLMLALRAYGYDSCPMEGFDESRVARLLGLPRGASIPMVIGAGVRADDGVYHPQIRFERSRFVFTV